MEREECGHGGGCVPFFVLYLEQWQMIRFTTMYQIIWTELSQESNFGRWQNSNILRIKLTFVQKNH